MKLRERLLVLLIAMTMLLSGTGLSVFAESLGTDGASAVASEEAVSEGNEEEAADAEAADEADPVDSDADAAEEASAEAETSDNDADSAEEAAAEEETEDTDSKSDAPDETYSDDISGTDTSEADDETELKLQTIDITTEDGTEISLEGIMPEDASAEAEDAADEKEVKKAVKKTISVEEGSILSAYDITIKDGKDEFQPEKNEPISVSISSDALSEAIRNGHSISVLHINDEGEAEEVEDIVIEEETLKFEAKSFSVYVVIDHEDGTVEVPRIKFHFIADGSTDAGTYFIGTPYEFINKKQETQTTQILKDGEGLELIADPTASDNPEQRHFYGWYMVDPEVIDGTTDEYGIGTADNKLYYSWPDSPAAIAFETGISVSESNVSVGDTVHWTLDGVSGSGKVDSDGNVNVFLAPLFEKHNFVNFMLRSRGSENNNLMTRKMVAKGSSSGFEVKISDIRSASTDPVHLVFTGWEYLDDNGTTDDTSDDVWVRKQTIDNEGNEIKDAGRDGVYLSFESFTDKESLDLYPIFVEARWISFVSGPSGSGASYVNSRYLESWFTDADKPDNYTPPADEPGRNVFTQLDTSTRKGYAFDGWYAFAKMDSDGRITNLDTPEEVEVKFIDVRDKFTAKTLTVTTTAVKVANADGTINNCGKWSVHDNGNGTGTLSNDDSGQLLFEGSDGKLRFYTPLDRLTLHAKWASGDSKITVVYWTENAQDKDTVVSQNERENYTASAVKTITTDDLTEGLSGTYSSGSTITLNDLAQFQESSVGILDRKYLDDVKAVPEGEEIFYDRNDSLSDASKVISGDGSTIYNVYFSRKTFKLVFHIGRDGYVKQNGQQKPEYMDPNNYPEYASWDGNWIQFMYDDRKITNSPAQGGLGYVKGPTAQSYRGNFTLTYKPGGTSDTSKWETYTSGYVTTSENVMGDYVPDENEDVYVITAKYGAYIGDRWPTPTSPNFEFTDPSNSTKSMYTWAGYYGSRYCWIAHNRSTYGNPQGNNPDINGVYNYMSAELCMNRDGTDIINDNQVHHLVAYYGNKGKEGIVKNYHILYEAIDGTYVPEGATLRAGSEFTGYSQTTWSAVNGNAGAIDGHDFYEDQNVLLAISNVEPQYQLGTEIDGYDLVYSCYNTPVANDHHIYFFYRPKQYTLTFMYEDEDDRKTDHYYYSQTLKDAKKAEYEDPSREGYYFKGWFTNEAGVGEPFDFANEKMPAANVVLYPVLNVLQYTVKIDPNGGVIDHRADPSKATYFTADYGTPIGEYTIGRDYIKLSEKEQDPSDPSYYDPAVSGQEWYYYVNTQFIGKDAGGPDGDWGYPVNLRNAIYLTENELDDYYQYFVDTIQGADQDYWTGLDTEITKEKFIETFADYPYRKVVGEHYTFMGWYKVGSDGKVDSMPYNFNDPVTGPLELKAKWRLDGGYYIQFVPSSLMEDAQGNTVPVSGDLDQLTDPADLTDQLYADQSPSHVLRAPGVPSGWVFRGWRVVRKDGTITYDDTDYPDWKPIQFDSNNKPVYYQPGDRLTIDSALATDTAENGAGKIIYMQAYYEPEKTSYRRPDVTNLILDSNDAHGGYVNTEDQSSLPSLSGAGSSFINTESELYDGRPTQILFGDIQSNLALHLYQYATTKVFNGVSGTNFFSNENGYLLLGFDEGSDPTKAYDESSATDGLRSGSPYIPTYAADSVASITRNKNKTLYALWEPMVYATFVNTTDEPITITLSGSGTGTVNIVNKVTGEFDREATTTTITVPAKSGNTNGEVKIVLPGAAAGTDFITAKAVNDHVRKKLSVSGKFGSEDPYGTGDGPVKYGKTATYTGTLQMDADGIIITYTEELDNQLVYDVNGGTWTETSEDYVHADGDIYTIDEDKITGNAYKPSDPVRTDMVFLGWTTNEDIKDHTDFSSTAEVTWGDTTITPDDDSNVLDKVKSEYLWDFSEEPPFGMTLYAVWSVPVTVTFDIVYTRNENASTVELHNWTDTKKTTQVSYEYCDTDAKGRYITYTMAKGDRVPKPSDPTVYDAGSTTAGWSFIKWLDSTDGTVDDHRYTSKDLSDNNVFNKIAQHAFDFSQHVLSDVKLVTSWTKMHRQTFTFDVENRIVNGYGNDEFTYRIGLTYERNWGKYDSSGTNSVGQSDKPWNNGNFVITTLKNNEQYTVQVTVTQMTSPWKAYSIEISVIDRAGVQIQSDQVVYCQRNRKPYFTSDYKYTLCIMQDEKQGYTTEIDADIMQGNVLYELDDPEPGRSLSFTSKENTTNNPACVAEFGGEPSNGFVADASNSLKIIFTNTGEPVAPTGYNNKLTPLIIMFAAGLAILAVVCMEIHRRKRREDIEF